MNIIAFDPGQKGGIADSLCLLQYGLRSFG